MMKLSYLLPLLSSHSSYRHHLLASILHFSTAAAVAVTEAQHPTPNPPPFILQYLIDSCGFSPDRAARASKPIAHIKSSSNPDSVIRFFKETGLDDAQIRDVVSRHPNLLVYKVEPTLKAKLRAMLELGFSESEIPRLIHLGPRILTIHDLKSKIELWRDFYPTNKALFKAMKRSRYLLTTSTERIMPNISLLRQCRLSDDQIAKTMLIAPSLITSKLDSMEALVRRAGDLGITPGSNSFVHALTVVHYHTESNIKSKIRLLESFGFCQGEILSAVQSFPYLLKLSEKNIHDTFDFLTKRAGCKPSYVIARPALLSYSLEKRLIPRHHVLRILKSMELEGGVNDLYHAIIITDEKFLDKFILPHKEKVPKLDELYIAACAGKVAIQSKD